ncbi:MAG TPA: AMP-binding protein [Rhodoferax sp.]
MNQLPFYGAAAIDYSKKPAIIHGPSGKSVTYAEVDQRSIQLARHLQAVGLKRGDRFSLFMENHLRYPEICWAAMRSGLLVVPVNSLMTSDEMAYIIEDSDSKLVVTSHRMRDIATSALDKLTAKDHHLLDALMVDGVTAGWHSYEDVIDKYPVDTPKEQWQGGTMVYSSGTSGIPKGIFKQLPERLITAGPLRSEPMRSYGMDDQAIYLSTAPLYHAAPLGYCLYTQSVGGTVIIMDKFDPELSLRLVEKYGITHSQWVPTMFVRLLRLPEDVKKRYCIDSLKAAIHGAGPCSIETKKAMIEWWGPVIFEYYGSSEGNGVTSISSEEWLRHPGSVGKPMLGVVHICDDDGTEVTCGVEGLVYFERETVSFSYHKDQGKTISAQHPGHENWSTVGDLGKVDEDGYLYLTGRQSALIISGGVNIYPQIVENALSSHPGVEDAVVIGVPNEEMGEEVTAVVQLSSGWAPSEDTSVALRDYLLQKIARYMIPRSFTFLDQIPRQPTGKLRKHDLMNAISREHELQEMVSTNPCDAQSVSIASKIKMG